MKHLHRKESIHSLPFCTNCGNQVDPGASFCPNCGHAIQQSTASPTVAASVTAPSSLLEINDIVVKKKIISIREHYDFEDMSGNKVGEGDGNFFQFPAKFEVFDKDNAALMRIQGKLISFRNQFTFLDSENKEIGTIKKKLIKLIGDEYWIEQNGVETTRIYGNYTEHDYRMEINKQVVATVHKKWIALRDTFGISITGSIDHRLVLGAVIAIEHQEVEEQKHNR